MNKLLISAAMMDILIYCCVGSKYVYPRSCPYEMLMWVTWCIFKIWLVMDENYLFCFTLYFNTFFFIYCGHFEVRHLCSFSATFFAID